LEQTQRLSNLISQTKNLKNDAELKEKIRKQLVVLIDAIVECKDQEDFESILGQALVKIRSMLCDSESLTGKFESLNLEGTGSESSLQLMS